ncbi:peroxidase, partial [Sarracenia purpurea var. burkii]
PNRILPLVKIDCQFFSGSIFDFALDRLSILLCIDCQSVRPCREICLSASTLRLIWSSTKFSSDSMTASLSAANSNLPSPASDLSTLISASSNKGFSATEMVALSVGSWPPCSDVLCCYFTIAMLFLGLLRLGMVVWLVHKHNTASVLRQMYIIDTVLKMLLRNSEDETIHGVAGGAIANLAMNASAEDPQRYRKWIEAAWSENVGCCFGPRV